MLPYELEAVVEQLGNAPAESMFPAKASLAMAYVPFQRFDKLYEPDKALSRGTLFACLDLPFIGGKKGAK